MAARREADRRDLADRAQRLIGERVRIDEHSAVVGRHAVADADEVDPLVVHRPPPDAGDDLLDAIGDCLRLGHARHLVTHNVVAVCLHGGHRQGSEGASPTGLCGRPGSDGLAAAPWAPTPRAPLAAAVLAGRDRPDTDPPPGEPRTTHLPRCAALPAAPLRDAGAEPADRGSVL